MGRSKKKSHPGAVDSSYTAFFILVSATISYLLASLFTDVWPIFWLTFLLSLIIYFAHDLIRQLYEPGEIILLHFTALLIFPVIVNWSFNLSYGGLAVVALWGGVVGAGILELLYNLLITRQPLGQLHKRLLGLDYGADTAMIRLSNRHLVLWSYRGFTFALLLMIGYYLLAYLLLPGLWLAYFR